MKHRNLWGLVDSEICHQCKKPFKPKEEIITIRACLGYSEPPAAEDRCYYHRACYEEHKHEFMTSEEIREADLRLTPTAPP